MFLYFLRNKIIKINLQNALSILLLFLRHGIGCETKAIIYAKQEERKNESSRKKNLYQVYR